MAAKKKRKYICSACGFLSRSPKLLGDHLKENPSHRTEAQAKKFALNSRDRKSSRVQQKLSVEGLLALQSRPIVSKTRTKAPSRWNYCPGCGRAIESKTWDHCVGCGRKLAK